MLYVQMDFYCRSLNFWMGVLQDISDPRVEFEGGPNCFFRSTLITKILKICTQAFYCTHKASQFRFSVNKSFRIKEKLVNLYNEFLDLVFKLLRNSVESYCHPSVKAFKVWKFWSFKRFAPSQSTSFCFSNF